MLLWQRKLREVNSSSDDATPWRLSIYQPSKDLIFRNPENLSSTEKKEKDLLLSGAPMTSRDDSYFLIPRGILDQAKSYTYAIQKRIQS